MPTISETLIDGYAHCVNGRCEGNKQQPVKVIQTLSEFSYVELGGDIPGIERSSTSERFNDLADAQCQFCGEPRQVADQKRPVYPNVSGVPQDKLLYQNADTERLRDLQLSDAKREAEMAHMRVTMERQQAVIERFMGQAAPKPKRAPSE
jgi:hypothetical protein